MFGYYISVPASATKGGKAVALPEEYVKRQSLKAEERCDLQRKQSMAAACMAVLRGSAAWRWRGALSGFGFVTERTAALLGE